MILNVVLIKCHIEQVNRFIALFLSLDKKFEEDSVDCTTADREEKCPKQVKKLIKAEFF